MTSPSQQSRRNSGIFEVTPSPLIPESSDSSSDSDHDEKKTRKKNQRRMSVRSNVSKKSEDFRLNLRRALHVAK